MVKVKNIGDRLSKLRKEKGCTLREVANSLNLDHSYIGKIEKGTIPSLEVLEDLADYYNVEVSYLITGQEQSTFNKWNKVIDLFEEKGLSPEDILGFVKVLQKL